MTKPLGELLKGSAGFDDARLTTALEYQQKHGGRLGEILLKLRLVDEDALWAALAKQFDLELISLAGRSFGPELAGALPVALCESLEIFPIELTPSRLRVAASRLLREPELAELSKAAGREVTAALAPAREVRWALARTFRNQRGPCPPPQRAQQPLGELLKMVRLIDDHQLAGALEHQQKQGGRLGEIFVAQGLVDDTELWTALSEQHDLPLLNLAQERLQIGAWVVPEALCQKLDLVPLRLEEGRLVVASTRPLTGVDEEALTEATGLPVQAALGMPAEVAWARDRLFGKQPGPCPPRKLRVDTHHERKRMRMLFLLWLGNSLSYLSLQISEFSTNIWVYQHTKSASQFAISSFWQILPGTLILPVAGSIADRLGNRLTLGLAYLGSGLAALTLMLLSVSGSLEVWHVWAGGALGSMFSSFRIPAGAGVVAVLTPKRHLGRVNGMFNAVESLGPLLTPITATLLLVSVGLSGILLVDAVALSTAVLAVILIRYPPVTAAPQKAASALVGFFEGWRFGLARPGLRGLLVLFALCNMLGGLMAILATLVGLSLGDVRLMGTVQSIGGVGMVGGGIALGLWGGPKRRVLGIRWFCVLCGVFAVVAGIRPTFLTLGIALFGYMFALPFISTCNFAIWQAKAPTRLLGRVFGMIGFICGAFGAMAMGGVGAIVDWLKDHLSEGGQVAQALAAVTGEGPAQAPATGLLFCGLLYVLTALVTAHPRVSRVEDEVKDRFA